MKFQLCETKVSLVNKTQQAVHYYTVDQGYLYKNIMHDSAWFCKILQNSEAFCKIYEKFEAFIPKVFVKKLPKIEANFTNFEVWCSKIELPKIEITNIEGYQYRGIPVNI